jgi:hypothetical protein
MKRNSHIHLATEHHAWQTKFATTPGLANPVK